MGRFFEVGGVEFSIDDHEGMGAADDEGILLWEIAQGHFDGEGVGFLVLGEGEDGIGVTGEDTGAGDAVDRFFREVAFGEVGAEGDGGIDFEGEVFDLVHEVGHIAGRVFVTGAKQFVEGSRIRGRNWRFWLPGDDWGGWRRHRRCRGGSRGRGFPGWVFLAAVISWRRWAIAKVGSSKLR